MKNILRLIVLLFVIILFNYSYSISEEAVQEVQLLTLSKGEIKVISVDNPTRVIVNNPEVIDITSASKVELFILGKSFGTTDLMWWDKHGQHMLQVQVLGENVGALKQRIDTILKELNLPNVSTRSLYSEGKIMLVGSVKTMQDLDIIKAALGTVLDKIINLVKLREEEAVIDINVQVLELDKDATTQLGFSWPGSTEITDDAGGTKWSTLFKVSNVSRGAFTLKLDALAQEGKARILSQPRLACQSGKEAELLVGGEKPILTTSTVSGGGQSTSVEYKEFGIKLNIRPTVTEERKIKLALKVEVSDVGVAETLGGPDNITAKAFPLTKRTASTELFINDNQTMSIGGLIKQKSEEDIRKTPWLGDIPVLGLFFKKKEIRVGGGEGERGDTELFIAITPTIMKEEVPKLVVPPPPAEKAVTKETPKPGVSPPAKEVVSKEVPQKPETKPAVEEAKPPQEAPVKEVKVKAVPKEPSEEAKTSAISAYIRKVAQRIRDNFSYPWAAQQAQIEGALVLNFRLDRIGQLKEIKVIESSGYGVLDENATRIIKKAAPYPPFPPEINQNELWIDFPIVYKIKSK
ncbi:MAG: TonB family protein [Candidatus Omnitrophica bacterium]|nr:TonB family protein [Candidatus Omnitrophota bacterium]